MDDIYINENNNDYDIILPFGFYFEYTISGKKIDYSYDSSFYISLLLIKFIFLLIF